MGGTKILLCIVVALLTALLAFGILEFTAPVKASCLNGVTVWRQGDRVVTIDGSGC